MRIREIIGNRKTNLTFMAGVLAALATDALSAFMFGETGLDHRWAIPLFAVLCIGLAFFCLKKGGEVK